MNKLDLSVPAWQRSHELKEFFREKSVQDPCTAARRLVLPLKTFEEYAGIIITEHPLFFHPEIFSSGSDFNSYGDFRYLTIDGLYKAVTVLAVANLIERRRTHGQDQSA